jgi:molybdenum cofactor cytidylyltransferase
MEIPKISVILLAAGLSQRMGQDKLLLDYRGKTLLQRAVDLMDCLPVFDKILVTTSARLSKLALPPGINNPSHTIQVLVNTNPEAGQSGSLRLGVSAAAGDAYLFMAADQPKLTPNALRVLLNLAKQNPGKIIYPQIGKNPCMPALFPACFREELLRLTGDTGGRVLRQAHPEACLSFEPENPQEYMDIDSEEDYKLLCVSDFSGSF